MKEKVILTLQKIILACLLIFMLLIIVGTFATEQEEVFTNIFSPTMRLLLLTLLILTIILFLIWLFSQIDKMNNSQLICFTLILFSIMIIICIVILMNFSPVPGTDALIVQDTATYFAETGSNIFDENATYFQYYSDYGNNNFITIIFTYFFKLLNRFGISSYILPLNILAIIGILISTIFVFFTAKKIWGMKKAVKALSLCVMNPVFYIAILWGYTNTFSIPFMMAILYFGISAYKSRSETSRVAYSILMGCSTVIGYYVRATVLIPFIALICCGLILVIKNKNYFRKYAKSFVATLFIGVLLFGGISSLNESYFSLTSDNIFPVTHWLMLASHGTGQNTYEDMKFTESFTTKAEKSKATTQKIIENYSAYSVPEFLEFLYDKLIISWGYGDGGDLLNKTSQDTKLTTLYSWVYGEKQGLFQLYCYAFRITNYLLIIVLICDLLKSKKILKYNFLFLLTFFGGILFYCFWEVKSSYAIPFLQIILLPAMEGGDILAKKFLIKKNAPNKNKNNIAFVSTIVCFLFVFIISYSGMTNTEITMKKWNVRLIGESDNVTRIEEGEDGLILTQEFYTSKPFNTIAIDIKPDDLAVEENAKYIFLLYDDDGNELYKGEIEAGDTSVMRAYRINIGQIRPEGKQKYLIRIQNIDGFDGKISFYRRSNSYVDLYEGNLKANDVQYRTDLWLQVYNEYTSSWCSKTTGLFINGAWFTILFGLLVWAWHCSSNKAGISNKQARK